MRILYVGTLPPHPGGSAVVAAQILRGLAGRGHRVRALAPITPETLSTGDVFAAGCPEIDLTRFLLPYFENAHDESGPDTYRQLEWTRILEALPGLVRDEHPDVLVIGRESVAWHVPDFAIAHDIPSLLIVHGGRTFASLEQGSWVSKDGGLLEQFRKTDRVVAVAEHLGKRLSRLGVNGIEVIPNPVDLERFQPRERDEALRQAWHIAEEDFVVVHASKLSSVKRPLDIVESARLALREKARLLYVVVGDGPLKHGMREACARSKIDVRFRFVGWVDHSKMPDYFNLADMVVMPSESEGQALVCLEAQACARVVLASRISGAEEIIRDGDTGMLFDKGDIEALTANTLSAAGDPVLRQRIGQQARCAASAHALHEIVGKYEASLFGLIAACSRSNA